MERIVSGRWPLGSEVRRRALAGGAMLYDASRAGNLTADWFDPRYWRGAGEIEGAARGRGAAFSSAAGEPAWVLRHYRRGGLMARLSRDRYWWHGEERTRPFAEWQLTYRCTAPGCRCRRRSPRAIAATASGIAATSSPSACRRVARWPSACAPGRCRCCTWIAIGRCIRRFHDSGVCHADLNAHNILLERERARVPDRLRSLPAARAGLVAGRQPGAPAPLAGEDHLGAARRALHARPTGTALLDGYRRARTGAEPPA